MGLDSTETNLQQIKQPFKLFKLLNADMSSTMSGYSPIFNAEHGTLNAQLFKPFKLQTHQTLQTA